MVAQTHTCVSKYVLNTHTHTCTENCIRYMLEKKTKESFYQTTGCASIGCTGTKRSTLGMALACGKSWSWYAHFRNSRWMLMRCFGCCLQNWHIDFFQYDFGQLRSNLWTSFFNVYFLFVFSMLRLEKFRKNDQLRSNLWGDQSSLSWTFPTLHSNTRGSMRNTSPTEWFGTIDAFHCIFFFLPIGSLLLLQWAWFFSWRFVTESQPVSQERALQHSWWKLTNICNKQRVVVPRYFY